MILTHSSHRIVINILNIESHALYGNSEFKFKLSIYTMGSNLFRRNDIYTLENMNANKLLNNQSCFKRLIS